MGDRLAQADARRPIAIRPWTRQQAQKGRHRAGGGLSMPEERENSYRDAAFLAMDDFLLAALFLWMTPLLTALSSLVDATLSASAAAAASPEIGRAHV